MIIISSRNIINIFIKFFFLNFLLVLSIIMSPPKKLVKGKRYMLINLYIYNISCILFYTLLRSFQQKAEVKSHNNATNQTKRRAIHKKIKANFFLNPDINYFNGHSSFRSYKKNSKMHFPPPTNIFVHNYSRFSLATEQMQNSGKSFNLITIFDIFLQIFFLFVRLRSSWSSSSSPHHHQS